MNSPQAANTCFLFLNLQDPLVANNMGLWSRINSTAFTGINHDPSIATAYDDGSAQYAPMVPNPADSSQWIRNPKLLTLFASHFTSSINARGNYLQEYEGEMVRLVEFPFKPSRFSCVFIFGSLDDCERASARFNWPRERVRSCNIAQWDRIRTARVSMDIASILISPDGGVGGDERKNLWRLYWSGASIRDVPVPAIREHQNVRRSMSEGDIWEHLVEGQLIVDRDTRY